RHRKDPAVEKIIYVPRRRVTISRHRAQIAAIDFIVTAAWEKEADPGGYNDVIGKERTVLQTEAAIQPEIVTRMVSEQHLLCNLSCRRPNIVNVHEGLDFGRNVRVQAVTDDEDSGINKVSLAFAFAGSKVRHKTIFLLKVHRSAGEVKALVDI